MEWLHEGRDCDFAVKFLHFGACDFPIKSLIEKPSKSCFFRLWRRDPVFGAVIFCAAVRSCIVFCKAVSANRIVMVASRCVGAMAACVILVSFAAEHEPQKPVATESRRGTGFGVAKLDG